ncbi:MAG: Vitamin B12 dependent methionine synthase activation subunit [Oscillospiraceae bacterium]|jgi:hypothetical protein|nr:Vitamin B12 dependent methionine synthase activation subunit [Oscillospiraceae bacterium]
MSSQAMQIDRSEIYRYLGYGRNDPEERIKKQTEAAVALLEKECTPRWIWGSYPVAAEQDRIVIAQIPLKSHSLASQLRGCGQACLFAATLGPAPDWLMQRASILAVTPAAVLQAAAAAMTEAFCDECCTQLAVHFAEQGLFLRPRFSPGYGDLSLSCQEQLLRVLNAQKHIGLSCTQSLLLVPTKSVTAIIGLTPHPEKAGGRPCGGKCTACSKTDCAYRLV